MWRYSATFKIRYSIEFDYEGLNILLKKEKKENRINHAREGTFTSMLYFPYT